MCIRDRDGTVEFWANDFDLNTFDNCTDCGPSELFYSFTENLRDSSFIFDCNDVGIQTAEIFITDIAGNKSSCVISFNVTPVAACGQSRMAAVDGVIFTEAGKELESVTVLLEDMENNVRSTDATTANGTYSFEAAINSDYMLKPEKDDDLLNGITTFDVILLRKHILGIDLLTSPYQLLAADINNSGSLSTLDLVILRKAILGIEDSFPNNTSWRFVQADYDFPMNPLATDMPQEVLLEALNKDMSVDFVGIKVGDINGSAITASLQQAETRSRATYPISVADRPMKQGQSYEVVFTSEASVPAGIQFTMDWNTDYITFDKVIENEFSRSENVGLRHIDRGLLTYSWDKQAKAANNFEYTIQITAKQDGLLSELLNITSTITPAEAYTLEGESLAVQLDFTAPITFEVLQNTPNPFTQSTLIPFVLPAPSAAKLVVMNTSGAVLKVVERDFEKGYNQISLEDLKASGVLYYRLETAFGTVTKKMVQVR